MTRPETLEDAIQSAKRSTGWPTTCSMSRLEDTDAAQRRCGPGAMAGEVRSALGTLDRDRHIDIESGVVAVTCDGAWSGESLENLVANGIGHTPSGRLRISIAGGDGRVRVASRQG
jgi:signal transduction histidine kinase